MNVETSLHPIIGYRKWDWDREHRRLVGPFSRIAWEPGTTTASCHEVFGSEGRQHDAPDPDCSCGLYADYEPDPLESDAAADGISADVVFRWFDQPIDRVYGAIALEGRVCLHERGVRGQRARIVALVYLPGDRVVVTRIAALYDAVPVPAGELRQAAVEFGVELAQPRPSPGFGLEWSPLPPGLEAALSLAPGPPHRPTSEIQRPCLACAECGRLFVTHNGLQEHRRTACGTGRHGGRLGRGWRRGRDTWPRS